MSRPMTVESRIHHTKPQAVAKPPSESIIPTNIRTFASSFFGDESPITEGNFTAEELAVMRRTIANKRRENEDLEAMYRNGSQVLNMDTNEWEEQDFSKELGTFEKTRGRTAVSYADYPGGPSGDNHRPESSLAESFTNPEYTVATTLGQYVAFKDKNGRTKVKDVYDWGDVDTSDMTAGDVAKAFAAAGNLRQVGNLVARVFKPNIRREVLIDLGMMDKPKPKPKKKGRIP